MQLHIYIACMYVPFACMCILYTDVQLCWLIVIIEYYDHAIAKDVVIEYFNKAEADYQKLLLGRSRFSKAASAK